MVATFIFCGKHFRIYAHSNFQVYNIVLLTDSYHAVHIHLQYYSFESFFLVSLAKVLSIVFIFPKNQLLVLLIFYIAFIFFHFFAI